ncbi:Pectinesterase inhibitor [Corchorus olitorius]|uniref:Pectinesterase inhibitor n=1 Tax=Corchorus olitorius TaxID=93759 RepID=A0A1R3HED4_9ROSI|nr:Pectinesterase inhibitor [Corchorus olitorius]
MAKQLVSSLQISIFLLVILNLNPVFSSAKIGVDRIGSLVRESCKNWTEFPNICISTLEADSRSISVNTFPQLCRVAMEVASTRISETLSFISQFQVNETDPTTQFYLKACVRKYIAGTSLIEVNAIPAFDEKDFEEAYNDVALVRQLVADSECDDSSVTKLFNGRQTELIQFITDVVNLADRQRRNPN